MAARCGEPDPKGDWARHALRINDIIDNQVRREIEMNAILLALIAIAAVAVVIWRGIALWNYAVHKKDL